MRRYDDENRTRYIGDISEMGARRGERTNPAVQIIHGLSRMQDNIRNIRAMRQEKALKDKQDEFAMKKADFELKEAELIYGPDAVASKKEDIKLANQERKIKAIRAERDLQREEIGAEQTFTRGVHFVRQLNKQLAQKRAEEKDDFFLHAGIDEKGNYTLSEKKKDDDYKIKELALKSASDPQDGTFSQERYNQALEMLRGSAAPSAAAVDPASIKGAPKDGQRARVPGKGIVQYNAKTRKWAKV